MSQDDPITIVIAGGGTAGWMTALWALATAGIDPGDVATRVTESLRNLAWLGFMYALVRRDRSADESEWMLIFISTTGICRRRSYP
jgi:hypothetical protein